MSRDEKKLQNKARECQAKGSASAWGQRQAHAEWAETPQGTCGAGVHWEAVGHEDLKT